MKTLAVFFISLLPFAALANTRVVTTTTTLAAVVNEIGGEHVDTISLTVASQDPHFVEAKPSYMIKLRQADLLVSVGMELEIGWIGNVRRGARNPKLMPGQAGHFEAGTYIEAIEVPSGKVDRAQGDVHPSGNPHFHLDPERMKTVAKALAEKLTELDPAHAADYQRNLQTFTGKVDARMDEWRKRIQASGIDKVITYHKHYNYFLQRFGLQPAAYIEPVPGVPPTAMHVVSLIRMIKDQEIRCILNEHYFEPAAAQRLQKEVKTHMEVTPVEADGDYIALIERLVSAIEACGKDK